MYILLVTATLGVLPPSLPPASDLAPLFREQQAHAIRDIRIDIQADLEHRGAAFFRTGAALRRLAHLIPAADTDLASR